MVECRGWAEEPHSQSSGSRYFCMAWTGCGWACSGLTMIKSNFGGEGKTLLMIHWPEIISVINLLLLYVFITVNKSCTVHLWILSDFCSLSVAHSVGHRSEAAHHWTTSQTGSVSERSWEREEESVHMNGQWGDSSDLSECHSKSCCGIWANLQTEVSVQGSYTFSIWKSWKQILETPEYKKLHRCLRRKYIFLVSLF